MENERNQIHLFASGIFAKVLNLDKGQRLLNSSFFTKKLTTKEHSNRDCFSFRNESHPRDTTLLLPILWTKAILL
jgi:hypothetical protein